MIKIEKVEVSGWEAAVRGMRNPMNSWDKSDTEFVVADFDEDLYYSCGITGDYECCDDVDNDFTVLDGVCMGFKIGPNDLDLMKRLAAGGSTHAKYRRFILVTMDITAPLYWWKEFDTYKVGTVANSCSTMHKIHAKPFEPDDFSHEHLDVTALGELNRVIDILNLYRGRFVAGGKSKQDWWQMIQLLPSSYNQKRTVLLNYEVLHHIYFDRKDHKLDEWHRLCEAIEAMPYSEIMTMKEN